MSICRKIAALRREREICQADLACDLLSRTILSRIENGRMLPSIPQLQHIADKLNVPISYFFNDSSPNQDRALPSGDVDLLYSYESCKYNDIVNKYKNGQLDNNFDDNKYYYTGMSYYHLGMYNSSIYTLRKYLKHYLGCSGDVKSLLAENYGYSLNTLCKIMIRNSNYNKALSYLHLAQIALIRYKQQSKRIYFTVTSNIGSINCILGLYDKVVKLLEPFVSINIDFIYTRLLANMHLSLNISYFNLGQYGKSIDHIKKAIFLYEYNNNEYDAVECHLNFINALRFDNQFHRAFNVLNTYKKQYSERYTQLDNIFNMQEITIYFNLEKYDVAQHLSKKIRIKELSDESRANYYFMLGHINYLKRDFNLSYIQLLKCESYFIKENYSYDLVILYMDLYEITQKEEYKSKYGYYKNIRGAKNIWCITD